MEFRLLGAVSVDTEDGELPLGPAKRRSVLAALLLRPNTTVPVDHLIDALWADRPPAHAKTVVQGHISRLRALLSTGRADAYGVELATRGAAYVLRMPETLLDAYRFEELTGLARQQKQPSDSILMLHEALALWHGPPLNGAVSGPPLEAAAQALEEARLTAVQDLARAHGKLGEHDRAVAVLRAETAAHPLREPLSAALVLALYRAGRQSEALDHYHRTRRLLADELGVDPGPELAGAYARVLRAERNDRDDRDDRDHRGGQPGRAPHTAPGDRAAPSSPAVLPGPGPDTGSAPHPPAPTSPSTPPPAPAPAEGREGPAGAPAGPGTSGEDGAAAPPHRAPDLLPRASGTVLGRSAELAALGRAAAGESAVCLVTGPTGVGKTTLAVHWAHRARGSFPDGRLFADLRGFSTTGEATASDVLHEFLTALGVAPRHVPESVNAAAALYRSLTADRRVLVVLDNARSSEQVRPLLPGGPGCVTVVTSRQRLDGLVATDCARPLPLGMLGPDDATALLRAALGEERVAAEPEAARRLAVLCDGLPLALRIVAARLATRPQWTLRAMADELADEQRRLKLLSAEDTGVEAALRLSVQQLPPSAGVMFRRLGLHTGPDLDRYAAAALAGCTPGRAGDALEQLAAAHLVEDSAPGRWTLHDLVRLYARSLADESDREGLLRLLDHYLCTALAAAAAAEPGSRPCCTLPPDAHRPTVAPDFPDRARAMDWYTTERANLTGAVSAAARAGLADRAWRIALLLWPMVVQRARDGWTPVLRHALDAAVSLGDPDAESRACTLLGWVLTEEGRTDEALELLDRAPGRAAAAGDTEGRALALVNLGCARESRGEADEAVRCWTQAAEAARGAGLAQTGMLALHHLARHLLETAGAPQEALDHCDLALGLVPAGQAEARRVLLMTTRGRALLALGRPGEALEQLSAALEAAERTHFHDGAVPALDGLAEAARALGRTDEAEAYAERHRRALAGTATGTTTGTTAGGG
ncbi:tetratricopeptide repeat protein [Streptomyces sp. SCUT-3]|uniref:AfsR/SARP family transcriptional regulator n=1 Tax=Streptomyces sp. SCUT-3 TaxID=2684469 RepID=UPI0015F790D5|nr:BTAD domain-containing putative transcriptional regulator [Streptomyces sp. SCUT-3]QMV22449.1 tetratricopeptide repeat protein [Streptomyces sp. SCUT-3]